jgi:hypothetical protein
MPREFVLPPPRGLAADNAKRRPRRRAGRVGAFILKLDHKNVIYESIAELAISFNLYHILFVFRTPCMLS